MIREIVLSEVELTWHGPSLKKHTDQKTKRSGDQEDSKSGGKVKHKPVRRKRKKIRGQKNDVEGLCRLNVSAISCCLTFLQICKLEVLECTKVCWPNAIVEKRYSVDDCGWSNKDHAYECIIKLITGKTQQIREQLAALGAPKIGDSMYMAAALAQFENPKINPFKKGSQLNYGSEEEKSKLTEDWASCHDFVLHFDYVQELQRRERSRVVV